MELSVYILFTMLFFIMQKRAVEQYTFITVGEHHSELGTWFKWNNWAVYTKDESIAFWSFNYLPYHTIIMRVENE